MKTHHGHTVDMVSVKSKICCWTSGHCRHWLMGWFVV